MSTVSFISMDKNNIQRNAGRFFLSTGFSINFKEVFNYFWNILSIIASPLVFFFIKYIYKYKASRLINLKKKW